MTSEARIAHLSDPHLPLGELRGAEWLGKRGLSGLSRLVRRRKAHDSEVAEALTADLVAARPDLVAMGGDLVNFGLEREFAAARDWLSRLGPPERVQALPGNHEALAPGWEPAIGRHWGEWADPERVPTAGPVALIPVWSAVATPPLMASGRVGANRLARLAGQLAAARAEGLLPVVAIHHPPTPVTRWRKSLRDMAATARVLAEGGAALVLHGHTHRRDLSWIDAPHGRIPVLGIPSFSMAPGLKHPPGAWRMLHVRRGEGGATVEIAERAITAEGGVVARTPLILRLPELAPASAATRVGGLPSGARDEGARA